MRWTMCQLRADPFALTLRVDIEGDEQRWQTLRVVEGQLLLLVAHATRNEDEDGQSIEVIRITSARWLIGRRVRGSDNVRSNRLQAHRIV